MKSVKNLFSAFIFILTTSFSNNICENVQWEYLNKQFITGSDKKMNKVGEFGWEYVADGVFKKQFDKTLKWEYLNKQFKTGSDNKMNELGTQGWEYVADGVFKRN